MLDLGDDQRIYREASGNPDGRPAVAVHGAQVGVEPGRRRYLPRAMGAAPHGVPEGERDGDLVAAYHRLLNGPPTPPSGSRPPGTGTREDGLLSNEEAWQPNPAMRTRRFWMALARIVSHYLHHGAWLDDGQILGRFDLGGPAATAWQLARAWPGARLHLVATGHAGGEEMTRRTLEATNRFARLGP